jgi:hypothetical protein
VDLLTEPGLLEAVQADWRKRMEGQVYQSPLPADLKPPLDQLEVQHAPDKDAT